MSRLNSTLESVTCIHTISIGLSSQWNFGRKMHLCLALTMRSSNIETWFAKSSWQLSKRAMQQSVLSTEHTGEHLARRPFVLSPHSSRVCWRPFASPSSVFMLCSFPRCSTTGLLCGMMVSFCIGCFPPLPLFIFQAWRAPGPREAWADDWSNMKRATQLGWASLNISIAVTICASNCSVSHQASPFDPG